MRRETCVQWMGHPRDFLVVSKLPVVCAQRTQERLSRKPHLPCAIRTSLGSDEAFRGLIGASARSVSDVVRILHRLPGGYVAGEEMRPALVIDSFSARKLARETRMRGYQCNQIVHELNRIAMYLLNLPAPALESERKRQIIGMQFWKEFFAVAQKLDGVKYLAQGTIYPDIIESGVRTAAGSTSPCFPTSEAWA